MSSTIQRSYTFNGRAYLYDSDIKSSRIVQCAISDLQDPINLGDAVSLGFLQSLVTTNAYIVVGLNGNDWFELDSMPLFGNRSITINNTISGAPNASWRVSKSDPSNEASITDLAFSPGSDGCTFEVVWMRDTALQIRKTLDTWNGNYEISVIR